MISANHTMCISDKSATRIVLKTIEVMALKGKVYERLLAHVASNYSVTQRQYDKQHIQRISEGHFQIEDLTMLCHAYNCCVSEDSTIGVSTKIVKAVTNSLLNYHLLLDTATFINGEYSLDRDRTKTFQREKLLENIVFGPSYVIRKLEKSIPAIITKDENSDLGTGTGIVFSHIFNDHMRHFVLTNKHVLENRKISEIIAGDETYNTVGVPVFSDEFDLAFIEISEPKTDERLSFINLNHPPLTKVIALGYPKIARCHPTLMAHAGEINGVVKEYASSQNYLAISCHVSPGNSGGPVIDELGVCAGIVTSTFFDGGSNSPTDGNYVNLRTPEYHMALPVECAIEFCLHEIKKLNYSTCS